ncbi:MAG: DNA mismatch repair protein MutS [Lewinellaceae bacterium]|nr:DNA mismatch repair protein MutS [Saprospiraceae bacterium]MCB9311614.1 DNA mismatch repair protein MutS [Lewinellaceae bacterium]HRW76219.1 DNA mismatch repair protein MutS [Saprospiraceae bacterium]
MQQYLRMKAKYKDAILLFRVGDFYETFGADAIRTAEVTGIVLTSRNNGGSDIELAGFPYHALDLYMPKLVKAGLRVAICEQLEKPSKDKKIVKRGVTEVITPGVTTDDTLLDHKSNNYLAAIQVTGRENIGVAFADISTGEFLVAQGNEAYLSQLIQHYRPAEVLIPKSQDAYFRQLCGSAIPVYHLEEWVFTDEYGRERLLDHFAIPTLKGFGVEEMVQGQIAAGAILHYLASTENARLGHIRTITRIASDDHVWLDQFTVRNLELVQALNPQGRSLLQVLDDTVTPMGARLMRHWIQLPLIHPDRIRRRQSIVEFFLKDEELGDEATGKLKEIGDLERLLARAVVRKINPRELLQLARTLQVIGDLKTLVKDVSLAHLQSWAASLDPCQDLSSTIRLWLEDDPPALLQKGDVIAEGVDPELDEWRGLIRNSKEILVQIQVEESQRTGIPNLKIGFNNVFGYYLEVTNKYKNQGLIPESWTRKQTTTNGERYITAELKKLEERILSAQERISGKEAELYEQLVDQIQPYIEPIQRNARLLAELDVLLGFGRLARKRQYVCPEINDGTRIDIRQGRHPVIEVQLPLGETYIPNDILLDPREQQIMMITGPNMSGKSALLRQTALICLMAQMGSYVPADQARIGLIDKVFTRVGASDNISSGESTFMVEMNETASIMNNISDRSLILLDEIGRGTATYDGISIAWAIAEYLHENGRTRPKTLFATHYHELNDLQKQFPRIRNFHVATQESGSKVLFLRKLLPGGSEHSFGIHVARMAGMPMAILRRAGEVLAWLETSHARDTESQGPQPGASMAQQLNMFEVTDPVMKKMKQQLLDMELNQMTPIECMLKLQEMKNQLMEETG